MSDPKAAGRAAVHSFRRGVAQRMVELLRDRDPDFLNGLVEVGVVSRDFVAEPGASAPVRNAPPLAVVERLLERRKKSFKGLAEAVPVSRVTHSITYPVT